MKLKFGRDLLASGLGSARGRGLGLRVPSNHRSQQRSQSEGLENHDEGFGNSSVRISEVGSLMSG